MRNKASFSRFAFTGFLILSCCCLFTACNGQVSGGQSSAASSVGQFSSAQAADDSDFSDYVIQWQDPVFETMVRQRLGMPTGDIKASQLDHINYIMVLGDFMVLNTPFSSGITDTYTGYTLSTRKENTDNFALAPDNGSEEYQTFYEGNITSLADLVHFRNVSYVYIGYEKLTCLDVPSTMPNVTSLMVSHNSISDLKGLEKFPNVTSFYASYNQIADISALSYLNLSQMHTLELKYNNIQDISVLKGLREVGYLNLMKNQITDISPLKNATYITALFLDFNQITDLSFLLNCQVNELHLQGNPIADYSFINPNTTVYGKA